MSQNQHFNNMQPVVTTLNTMDANKTRQPLYRELQTPPDEKQISADISKFILGFRRVLYIPNVNTFGQNNPFRDHRKRGLENMQGHAEPKLKRGYKCTGVWPGCRNCSADG